VWDTAIQAGVAAAGEIKVSVHIPAPAAVPVKLRKRDRVLRGSDPALKDTYLVLTAHYDHLGVRGSGEGDHIYNGANDDASGTSSVVEICEDARRAGPEAPPQHRFCDVVRRGTGRSRLALLLPAPRIPAGEDHRRYQPGATGPHGRHRGAAPAPVQSNGLRLHRHRRVLEQGRGGDRHTGGEARTEQRFVLRPQRQRAFAEAGVPSTTLSVAYIYPDYHRPGDEWPKLDYDNMAKVDDAVALGVFRIADSVEAPQWNKANPKTPATSKRGKRGAGGQRPVAPAVLPPVFFPVRITPPAARPPALPR